MTLKQIIGSPCPHCGQTFQQTSLSMDENADFDRHNCMLFCPQCGGLVVIEGNHLVEAQESDLQEMYDVVPDIFEAMVVMVKLRRRELEYEAACERHFLN